MSQSFAAESLTSNFVATPFYCVFPKSQLGGTRILSAYEIFKLQERVAMIHLGKTMTERRGELVGAKGPRHAGQDGSPSATV